MSKYKGVHWHKPNQKWITRITINNKRSHIGCFSSEIQAALAYNEKAIELYGEYARLNVIEETL